jgi:hypothetical protein
MSEMEEILRKVARKVHGCVTDTECERVLREKLLRLLEAGQDFRDALVTLRGHNELTIAWDAAKAAIRSGK